MVFRYLLIIISIILLISALLTNKWQTLSLKNTSIRTDIGLWKTCSVLENGDRTCHVTKLDTEREWELNGIRVIATATILGLLILCILLYKKSNKGLIILTTGLSTIASCAVPFLYSTYMENYFSQDFDELMISKYNYSFYLQSAGALMLLITSYILCYISR